MRGGLLASREYLSSSDHRKIVYFNVAIDFYDVSRPDAADLLNPADPEDEGSNRVLRDFGGS